MDNKQLGTILIIASVVLLILLVFIRFEVTSAYQVQIDSYIDSGKACPSDPDTCPHELKSKAQIPIFIAGAVLFSILMLGLYLILFEKSQKEILSILQEQKQLKLEDEKFDILLKGLDTAEKKVMKAVKDQDGITQQTLRLRTDLHKSKLSIVLDGLEKKDLIARKIKGKTKEVFMKINI